MAQEYIEMRGTALAAICERAGFGAETLAHWRSYGAQFVEVSKASVDDALAKSKRGPNDHIGRDVEIH